MTLNVLWRSAVGSSSAHHADLLDARLSLTVEKDKEKAKALLGSVHILVDGRPDPDMLDAPQLGHVVVPYVGISSELREAVAARPHLSLHNSHFNDAFVAQHALALLLACSNRIPLGNDALHRGDWTPRYADNSESLLLEGKTCLLLGYGAIGRALKPKVQGLGMSVRALRRHPEAGDYGPAELLKALSEADVVILSLPSTPETRGLLNAEAFATMRPGSILVNVGRGDVIDQHAFHDALKTKLRGAGSDVWWTYPQDEAARTSTLPADAPLHELSNLVMSPHRAAHYEDWDGASFRDVAETLNAIARGESRNDVAVDKGY